jgi:osmotically-inducible protein OsmY
MVTGVLDVLNSLIVSPPPVRTDSALAADVRAALALDSDLDRSSVAVSVAHGVTSLRGEVPSCFQVSRAAEDAWSVPGVVEVANELKVARSTRFSGRWHPRPRQPATRHRRSRRSGVR